MKIEQLYSLFRTVVIVALVSGSQETVAGDWSRFRGPNGSGVDDSVSAPVRHRPSSPTAGSS